MVNTTFFVQCKDCENCSKTPLGYFCEEHIHEISNPNVDGCTWGREEKDGDENG